MLCIEHDDQLPGLLCSASLQCLEQQSVQHLPRDQEHHKISEEIRAQQSLVLGALVKVGIDHLFSLGEGRRRRGGGKGEGNEEEGRRRREGRKECL